MSDNKRTFHEQIPPWFVAAFALTYISGYLIEFLYYASFGIVDSAGDIFKLKYIHTGIIFLISSTLIAGYVAAWFLGPSLGLIPNEREAPKPGLYVSRYVVFTALSYVFSLYMFVILTPLHYVKTWPQWIGIFVLVLSFLAYVVVLNYTEVSYRTLYDSLYSEDMEPHTINHLRTQLGRILIARDRAAIFFLIFVGGPDVFFLAARWDAIGVPLLRSLFYVGLVLLIPLLVWRLEKRRREAKERGEQDGRGLNYTVIIVGGGLVCFLLFLTLMTYSYWVFPLIPSSKGGADYEGAPRVTAVFLDEKTREIMSTDFVQTLVIYSTESSYYFAKPLLEGEQKNWNTPCEWRVGNQVPKIREIRRDQVQELVMNAGTIKTNCEK